jgi:predicted P-loop ATPase
MSIEPEIDGEVPAKVVGLDDARAKRSKRRSEWPAVGEDNKPVHKSQQNVRHFLEQIGCELFFDAFASRHMVTWNGRTAALDDATLLAIYFRSDAMGLRPSKAWFTDCLVNFANLNQRNDVRARIDTLQMQWDGKPRLDGWLVRHAGGEDTAFARMAFKIAFVAMVARIRKPGIKFDQIIVLESQKQGEGKSTLLRIIAGNDALFTDALPIGADDRITLEIAHGKIIIELGELAGIGKRDLAAVKAFASRQFDRARLAYGRFAVEVPRQFVIWGTTNDDQYLADPTGNRRFWPLRVKQIDLTQARADVDQLWAEAATLEADGHPITLPEELWGEAAREQTSRLVSDTWEDAINDRLDLYRTKAIKVRTIDVLKAIGVPLERQDRGAQMRVAAALKKLGFESKAIGKGRWAGWMRCGPGDAVTLICDTPGGELRAKGGNP